MISLFTPARKKSNAQLVKLVRWTSYLLLMGGIAAVGYTASILAIGRTYQMLELQKFKHEVILAEPHIPLIGEAIGEVQIPRLALKAVIIQGASVQILHLGVGHLPDTPMLGEQGNVALAGHRDTYFRSLRHIHPGDEIILRTFRGETFQYRVASTSVVSPREIEVLEPSGGRELTLITCFPFDYIGPAPNRFIVRAFQVGLTNK